ncbi:MAG: hypothetical protein LIO79_02340 [Rikenellaceae bacterium]|nr:hypothetical protein [Rikenellaceae bacterium]
MNDKRHLPADKSTVKDNIMPTLHASVRNEFHHFGTDDRTGSNEPHPFTNHEIMDDPASPADAGTSSHTDKTAPNHTEAEEIRQAAAEDGIRHIRNATPRIDIRTEIKCKRISRFIFYTTFTASLIIFILIAANLAGQDRKDLLFKALASFWGIIFISVFSYCVIKLLAAISITMKKTLEN